MPVPDIDTRQTIPWLTRWQQAVDAIVSLEARLTAIEGGGGEGYLLAANDLSDLANVATALSNLGLSTVVLTGALNQFSVLQKFNANVAIQSTDATATKGPLNLLYRISPSPAANDLIGAVDLAGQDDAGNYTEYAILQGVILDPTNTSEDGALQVRIMVAGTQAVRATFQNGLYMAGATDGDKGAGTVNATELYINGVILSDRLRSATAAQEITGGFRVDPFDIGTVSSGTTTLDPGNRPLQKMVNNGAHTLAPGANTGAFVLTITNGASAGALTTSGWTQVSGDAFTTTSGHIFTCHVTVDDAGSHLQVSARQ